MPTLAEGRTPPNLAYRDQDARRSPSNAEAVLIPGNRTAGTPAMNPVVPGAVVWDPSTLQMEPSCVKAPDLTPWTWTFGSQRHPGTRQQMDVAKN